MEVIGKLLHKSFISDKGEVIEYYVIEFPLDDENTIETKIKSDKAKLLIMADQLKEMR